LGGSKVVSAYTHTNGCFGPGGAGYRNFYCTSYPVLLLCYLAIINVPNILSPISTVQNPLLFKTVKVFLFIYPLSSCARDGHL